MTFKQNYLATGFKVIHYGFEIFQTAFSLNYKIMKLNTLNLVIKVLLMLQTCSLQFVLK